MVLSSRGCTANSGVLDWIEIHQVRPLLLVSLSTMERASLSGEAAIVEKGVMLTGWPLGNRKGYWPNAINGTWRALVSAHAHRPSKIKGQSRTRGLRCAKWCDRCRCSCQDRAGAAVSKKDEPVSPEEEKREYYMNKLEHTKEASHRSSACKEIATWFNQQYIEWPPTTESRLLQSVKNYDGTFQDPYLSIC